MKLLGLLQKIIDILLLFGKKEKNPATDTWHLIARARRDDLKFCGYWVGDEIFYFKSSEGIALRFFSFAVLNGGFRTIPF